MYVKSCVTMFVLVLICLFAGYLVWRHLQTSVDEPPTVPGGWPIVGHVPRLLGNSRDLWYALKDFTKECHELGGVVSAFIGPRTVYVVADPDDALTVSNTCLEKDEFYDFAKPWLGEGLVTGKLSIWKSHRKLLQPAFSPIVLDGFLHVFNSQARKLVQDLEVEVGRGLFDHWRYTRHNALETICLTALGVDFSDHKILNTQYVDAIEKIFNALIERVQKVWLHCPYIFKFSAVKKAQDECLEILLNMSNTVLKLRKSALYDDLRRKANNNIGYFAENKTKLKPFMDLLLELSFETNVFSDRQIREHVDTMIVAGHDTSANVLMFTLLLLGSHPEAQDRAYNELQEVFGDSDRDVEKADLQKLVYLEAVLKESMRIHTIVPLTVRWLDKDVKLKNYTLSAGRTCFIFLHGIHRHPVWGPDVDEFKPERWLDRSTLPQTPNAYSPFMMGRRTCIGKGYAYMSMKTTLSHLLRRYKFHADDSNLILKLDIMVKPQSGYYVSIEDRQ